MSEILHGGSLVAGIEVRVLRSERHTISSTPSRYSLEDGKSIADHVTLNPNTVEIQFEMTNTDRGAEEARQVAQQFLDLRDQRQRLTLETEHFRYENMIIESFTPEHASPFKGAFNATLRLTQIGIVGVADMVSASGGRPSGLLAGDGVRQTASGRTSAGTAKSITAPPLLNACRAYLRRTAAGGAAAV